MTRLGGTVNVIKSWHFMIKRHHLVSAVCVHTSIFPDDRCRV